MFLQHLREQFTHHKELTAVIFGFFIFLAIFSFFMTGYDFAYAQKIYYGVKIGDFDLGGQTIKEAEPVINNFIKNISTKKLTIDTGSEKLTPTFNELGIYFDSNQLLSSAYNLGRSENIWTRVIEKVEAAVISIQLSPQPIIDEDKLSEYFSNNSELSKEPKDATLKVDSGELIVVLSEEGNEINSIAFKKALIKNIKNNQISDTILLQTKTVEPSIDESDISNIKPEVERAISQPIIIKAAEKTFTTSMETMSLWLVIKAPLEDTPSTDLETGWGKQKNKTPLLEFSDEKINDYIKTITRKVDIKAVSKKINSTTNQVIEEGSDGREINQKKLLANIKQVLNNADDNRTINAEIITKTKSEERVLPEDLAAGGTPGLYEGKYIEIDLSEQKLFAFEGSNRVFVYTVSTGKWSTPTPIGTRHVESKTNRAYSSKYKLYMPFWLSLGGGYGIHELPEWANGVKEGESHLGTPVSHGCIRLGVGSAETIYNWTDIGIPVYIHK